MEQVTSYRTYWSIWVVLLVLTLLMIFLEAIELSVAGTVILLSAAMLVKATLITGWFMHLRYERMALVLCIGLGILVTAAFMYFLLIPDAMAVHQPAPR